MTIALKALVFAGALAFAAASCPNSCSGHGTCGNDDVCTCYQDWLTGDTAGGDCSERRCPFDHSWADTPSASNTAHALAECSGKGICDRKTGECDCFDGYWGKACRRAQCPNDCSGHGTCEYIKELRNDVGDGFKWTAQFPTSDQYYHTFNGLWDFDRQMACLCDPKYTDVDCSRRMCPKGNYALYSDGSVTPEVQLIYFSSSPKDNTNIAFTFRSTLGEEYTTQSTFLDLAGGTIDETLGASTTASMLQNNLMSLPNKVIDDVTVSGPTGQLEPADTPAAMIAVGTGFTWSVTFLGKATTGNQNMLTPITHTCGSGCNPHMTNGFDSNANNVDVDTDGGDYIKISESDASTAAANYGRWDYAAENGDVDNDGDVDDDKVITQVGGLNTECSGRGTCDYETGLCECFSGYTDEACSTQTALI